MLRASRRTLLVGTALLAISCEDLPPAAKPYLDQPFFQFTASDGDCVRVVAVDGLKQGWTQEQCGNATSGYLPTRVLTDAEFAQVQTAFDALPAQPDPACNDDFLQPGITTFLRRGTTSADITWTACVAADALAEPYLTPVNLLKAFVVRP